MGSQGSLHSSGAIWRALFSLNTNALIVIQRSNPGLPVFVFKELKGKECNQITVFNEENDFISQMMSLPNKYSIVEKH